MDIIMKYFHILHYCWVNKPMPVYTFKCTKCMNVFDEFVHTTTPTAIECKKCKKNTAHKQFTIGNTHIVFKGSGFYNTDYKK